MTKREASRRIRLVARDIIERCEQAQTQQADPDPSWASELAEIALQLDGRYISDLPTKELNQ